MTSAPPASHRGRTAVVASSLAIATIVLMSLFPLAAHGQDSRQAPSRSRFSAVALGGLIGDWSLQASFNGRPVEMQLEIGDTAGEARAALSTPLSPQPQLIEDIQMVDGELDLAYDASFGGQSARIHIKARLEKEPGSGEAPADEILVGTFGDEGGFFSADFTGRRAGQSLDLIPKAVAAAEALRNEPQREKRFGGTVAVSLGFPGAAPEAGSTQVQVVFGKLALDSKDRELFVATKPGEVFQYPGARVIKLTTGSDLSFGDVVVPAGNLAAGYRGAYGLWLEKTAAGWTLVFNDDPDVWGTMHDPRRDRHRVPLEVAELEQPVDPLDIAIERGAKPRTGVLRFSWGNQVLVARFGVE